MTTKKTKGILLLILLNLFLFSFLLSASAATGTINTNYVHIRSGPATTHEILGMLNQGSQVEILGSQNDWYQVRAGQINGWIRNDFINLQKENSLKASPTPVKPPVVILDGRQLTFEVPPTIENGRTLVPLRAIFEAMGASVSWDNNTRTVTSVKDTTTVILPIGSTRPTVNGQVWPLEVPAKIKNDRTLAPLRFVGEAFGGKVDWNSSTRTITITSPIIEEPKPEPPPKPDKPGPGAIWLSYSLNEKGLQINMDSGAKLNASIREAGSKVTYEFKDCQIEGLNLVKQSIGSSEVKAKARNAGDNTIVEIDFPYNTQYQTASENGGRREVFIIPNAISSVERKSLGQMGERLIINTLTPAQCSRTKTGNVIEIRLEGAQKGKARDEYKFDDSTLIKNITFQETTGKTDATIIKIITTDELGKFIVGQTGDGSTNILLVDKNQIKARRENLVVLDPGHGGRDTGARGKNLDEKDVNLKIALKAGQLLKNKGIEVEYTRTTDKYVGLEERATIANRLNAGVFVSIHNNASTRASVQGTETYYYAPVNNDLLFLQLDERKSLATNLHQQLIAKLKRPNRGVKTANFSVLRNTTMPSALVECVFISNSEEEQLLQQNHFIQLTAEAIANGIAAYMGK